MPKRDYYEVLGVSQQATIEEIKRSFRAKARVFHPDNSKSGDEAAFKELAEAYDVLCDERKRSVYDKYGHEGLKGTSSSFDNFDFSNFAGFGIDDLIDAFFGGGLRSAGRRSGPESGANLQTELEIDFLEAVFGGEKTLTVKRLEECKNCSGSGATPGSKVIDCSTCHGMGQVQQVINSWFGQSIRVSQCPSCQGDGKRLEKPCKECRGQGLERKNNELKVPIPAGIENGSRLRITGSGDKGRRGGGFGDLYILIRVHEHERFIRDGENIFIKETISFSQAALGTTLSVPTVDGAKPLEVPAGTQSGTLMIMKNLGVSRLNNANRRGDQLVQLIVETPIKLSSEQRKLFEELAQLSPTKNGHSQQKDSPKTQPENESIINKIVEAFKPKQEDQI